MGRSLHLRALFALCAALLVAPLWLVPFPPMIDLPQHAAQVYLLRHLDDPGTGYAETFRINWLTPYYFGYGIAWLLSHLMPITTALRLELSLALVGIPLAMAAALRESGGRPAWALLAFPIAYSSNYVFGFVNFMAATPLLIWALVPILRYARQPTRGRALILAGLALFFLWCHAVLAVLYGLVGCLLVGPRAQGVSSAIRRSLPFAASAPLAMLWVFATRSTEAQTGRAVIWRLWSRAPDLLASLVGGFRFSVPWIVAGLALVFLPFLTGARLARAPHRWLAGAVCTLLYLTVPYHVFGTAFLYMRFEIFAFVLFLIALDPVDAPARTAPRRWQQWAIPVFVVALLLAHASRVWSFGRESRSFERILAAMDPGRRVLSLILERTSAYSQFSVYHHFVSWYLVEKGGYVDFSFAAFFPEMVRFRPGREPAITESFTWVPQTFDWAAQCGSCYDYIVVRSSRDVGAHLFHDADRPVRLRDRSGPWWLYEVGPR